MDWITSTSPGLVYYFKYANPITPGMLISIVIILVSFSLVCRGMENFYLKCLLIVLVLLFPILLFTPSPHSEASQSDYMMLSDLQNLVSGQNATYMTPEQQSAKEKAISYFKQTNPGTKLTNGQAAVLRKCYDILRGRDYDLLNPFTAFKLLVGSSDGYNSISPKAKAEAKR